MPTKRPPLDELLSLFGVTIAAQGITTGAGAAAGNSFIDAGLAGVGANSFISMLAILYPGQPRLVDSMDITGFNNATGEVTLSTAYKGVAAAIPAGVPYNIVTFRFVPAEVAAIEAKLDNATYGLAALKAYVDTLETVCTAARLAELDPANIPADLDTIKGYLDTEIAAILAAVVTEVADILAYVDCLPAALGDLVTKNLTAILSDSTAFAGADIATIKGYVDLIDDATNGLAAIKAEVEGLAGAAMRGTDGAALAASWTAALATALGNYTAARAGYLDNINQAGLLQLTAARAALLDQITALRMAELDAANIPADLTAIYDYITDLSIRGRLQIKEFSITSAANAGDVVVATITTQPCQIESVVIHANAAQTADMTSCGIFGGAGKVITFISAADAIQANLNAADKQIAWSGVVRLAAAKTIVISLVGTGATAVNLTIVVKYRACASGGYLA